MTGHEKECAFAAIAALIEKAKTAKERRELKTLYKEIQDAPLTLNA